MSKRSATSKQIESATADRVLVCSAALIFEPPLVSTKIKFGKQLAPYCYMPEQAVSPEDAERLCESLGSDVKWITAAELERRRGTMMTEKKRDLASFDLEQLEAMLAANISKDRADLPANLHECLENSFTDLLGRSFWEQWDDYPEEQRRRQCDRWIAQHHPARAEEREKELEKGWRDAERRHEIEGKIRDYELIEPKSITELAIRDEKLAALRGELDKLKAKYEQAGAAEAATAERESMTKAVTAREIMVAFAMPGMDIDKSDQWWNRRMRDADRYHLTGCRIRKGVKGNQSMWQPDLVAGWLTGDKTRKRHMTDKHVAGVLRTHFPDCSDTADLLDPPDAA